MQNSPHKKQRTGYTNINKLLNDAEKSKNIVSFNTFLAKIYQ